MRRKRSRVRHGARNCHVLFRRLRFETLEDRRLLAATFRLDDPRALVGDVGAFQISLDNRFAVYTADSDANEDSSSSAWN